LEKKGVADGFRTGDLIILLAVVIWSASAIYLKRILSTFIPFQVVLYSTLFSVPFFFFEALLWDGTMVSRLDAPVIGSLLYQSLITASFGFVAWNNMLQKYGAVSLHTFMFIMPIAGVAMGGTVLGEPITVKILLALALIVSGILVVHWHPKKASSVYPLRRGF
jgi:drug/metabolite transporter (DMT)-like permease